MSLSPRWLWSSGEAAGVTGKEQRRVAVLQQVTQGVMMAAGAADVLGLSVCRLVVAYPGGGASGMRQGERGRPPAHTLGAAVRRQVSALARTAYHDCNPRQLREV